jgi:hypothetical protein
MNTTEYVMAVLCAPLTGLDLQRTERANNVVIMRMLEYDNTAGYFSNERLAANLIESPIRMMFVFGQQDIIIIRTAEDKREIYRRLNIPYA